MHERILIAGSGGQGVISLGKLLALLAVDSVPHVTFFPAYGAEVRGGTSNCQVILSAREIASPVAEEFDSVMIMNQLSSDRFLGQLRKQGVGVLDSSLCLVPADPRLIAVPATETADRLGSAKAANFAMLGAWLKCKPLIKPEAVEQAIPDLFPGAKPELLAINLKAFRAGLAGT